MATTQILTESSYSDATATRMLFHPTPSSAMLQSLNLCSPFFSYPYTRVVCSCLQCQSAKTSAPPTSYATNESLGSNYLRYHSYYRFNGQDHQNSFKHSPCSEVFPNTTGYNYGRNCSYDSQNLYLQSSSSANFNSTAFSTSSNDYAQYATTVTAEPYDIMGMRNECNPTVPQSCVSCSLSHSMSPTLSASVSSLSPTGSRHSVVSPNQLSDVYDSSPENSDDGGGGPESNYAPQSTKSHVELKAPAYRSHFGNRQPRKDRLCFSPGQIQQLEVNFSHKKYLGQAERQELAERIGISEAQVKTWYQNRRTKWKRGQKISA